MVYGVNPAELPPYPLDIALYFKGNHSKLDLLAASNDANPGGCYSTTVAVDALAHWNQYLAANEEMNRQEFLLCAYWLVENEVRIAKEAGGWPILPFHPDINIRGPWLSALMQGCGISVLARAYLLTTDEVFLGVLRRAVSTFELDILDGGVCTPIGNDGVFFEEIAVYPAAHRLIGFIVGLFGLYDYLELTADSQIEALICRSHRTLHDLLCEFDVGFWTRSDLLHRRLASPRDLALQARLLEALAIYSDCEECAKLAKRWKCYQSLTVSRLRYLCTSACISFAGTLLGRVRSVAFPKARISPGQRVCVPITAFPFAGGMRTVLDRIAQVTKDTWQIEYLTQLVGAHTDELVIHRFSTARISSTQFPNVWLYVLAGFCKLLSLMRHETRYQLILPQDGVFTSAFSALAAKIAGVRCVCIDHGNLGLHGSHIYRAERIRALATKKRTRCLLDHLRYKCYWPSLYLLAWFSARLVDHYFIPGVSGDGVELVCKRLGVPQSRITRFANMINIERHVIPDLTACAERRGQYGIAVDAIVIAIVCRLAPEKGLEIAVEAIGHALSALSPGLQACLRVIIVGDGPLRAQLEEDIRSHGLHRICLLCGQAKPEEVITLLGISDIFLFTSWRAAGYPLAILEAMASGCAVIASSEPLANEYMLAEGRGIIVSLGNTEQTAKALVRLVEDQELRRQMGELARNYVALHHSASVFRRSLMRVTGWSALDRLLGVGVESNK